MWSVTRWGQAPSGQPKPAIDRVARDQTVPEPIWTARIDARLDEVRGAGRWRTVRRVDAHGPVGQLDTAGAPSGPVTSFASNDYLGLSAHPAVAAAAHAALDRWGTGATASRLVVGSRPPH